MPKTKKARPNPSPRRKVFGADQKSPGRADDFSEVLNSAESPASAVLVVGVPGSGRSTLLETVHATATVPSAIVAPHPWEKDRPLAGLSLALDATGDRRLSEFMSGISLDSPTVDETIAVAVDVLALLREGSRDETLLIIDDADQFDPNTQLALTYLAGRLSDTGLRMVLAVRPEATRTAFAGIHSVWMSRLTSAECLELARSVAPDADEQVLAMVCDACSGLPGMITSTLDQLSPEQLRGERPLALPLHHGPEAIAFASWAPENIRLLQRLSTAPLCSLSALPNIRDLDRDVFEQLTSQGVLTIIGPYVAIRDGAFRSSIYWSMNSAQRAQLHSLAAIEEEGHSRALVLWHIDHFGDHRIDRSELVSEATELLQQGLVPAAIEFVERALLLTPNPASMVKQLLDICNRLSYLSEFGLSRRYLAMCRNVATKPRQLAECLRVDAAIASLANEPIDTGAIDVYAERYRKDSPRVSAELLAFAAVYLVIACDVAAARTEIDRAYKINPASKVAAGSLQDWVHRYVDGVDGQDDASAPSTADINVDRLPEVVQLVAGRALMVEERYDEARLVFRGLTLDSPGRSRGAAWMRRVLSLCAQNEIRAGRIAEASHFIDRLVELAPNPGPQTLLLIAWNNAVVRGLSDPDLVLSAKNEHEILAQHPSVLTQLFAFEGYLALMHGDLDQARTKLARVYEACMELRPEFVRMEGDFVEVLALRGEWDAARKVTDRLVRRAGSSTSAWLECVVARCQAIVAPDDQVVQGFANALAISKRLGQTFESARTRLAFAAALERCGQVPRAAEQRLAASYAFEGLLAEGWVQAARRVTVAVEAPAANSLLSTLTENELAVLRLMHQGVRNKDIAAALFVSLRTVEVRITQIYRKLEARSRSHLLTLVPELGPADPD